MEKIKDKITFLMRVKKDVWVEVEERCKYAGKLKGFKGKGLFQNVIYQTQIRRTPSSWYPTQFSVCI
ncbi:MAG: hypothetical protein J7J16_01565 [Deltaproteobacteria bacterium]|nr:hypothetical protein [Deltaproteobacteria bacterium]